MNYYLIIGFTEPGAMSLFIWDGFALSLQHAEQRWRDAAWEELDLDAEEIEEAIDEGRAPFIEFCYVSDSVIRNAT